MAFNFESDDVLLDIDEICRKLSISRSTLDRLRPDVSSPTRAVNFMQQLQKDEFSGMPEFPLPTVKLGRSPRWSAKVLNAWINGPRLTAMEQIAARTNP